MQMSKIGQIAFVAACGRHAHDSAACSNFIQHEVRKPKFKESFISSPQKGDVGFHSEASAVPEEAFSATAFSDSDGFSQKLLLQHQ